MIYFQSYSKDELSENPIGTSAEHKTYVPSLLLKKDIFELKKLFENERNSEEERIQLLPKVKELKVKK